MKDFREPEGASNTPEVATTDVVPPFRLVMCLDCRRALPYAGPRCGPCTALASLSLRVSEPQRDVTGSDGRVSPNEK
jgi:hypothetical protein